MNHLRIEAPETHGAGPSCGDEARAQFLTATDPRWHEVLRRVPHDFYHLPEYVALSARLEDATPAAFYMANRTSLCLIPLLIRRLPAGLGAPESWTDAASPYGYAPPLFLGDSQWIGAALHSFVDHCASNNVIAAFLRMHPLLPFDAAALSRCGTLVHHGQTVYIDLAAGAGEFRAQTRPGYRYDIRSLRRQGFRVSIDDWACFETFIDLYLDTMRRRDAAEYYRFPREYFHELRTALGGRLHLFSVLSAAGTIAAAGLFAATEGLVQYHLSGAAEEFRGLAPTKLMLDEARNWALDCGYRLFHLGGGLGAAADSLFQFKAGFSPLRSDFCTFRMVCDPGKYGRLVNLRDGSGSREPASGYFPEYRKPL